MFHIFRFLDFIVRVQIHRLTTVVCVYLYHEIYVIRGSIHGLDPTILYGPMSPLQAIIITIIL
jgi:hypothetical protein